MAEQREKGQRGDIRYGRTCNRSAGHWLRANETANEGGRSPKRQISNECMMVPASVVAWPLENCQLWYMAYVQTSPGTGLEGPPAISSKGETAADSDMDQGTS
ncbi:MAG: hypothetical protein M1833_002001 [Piccolia ochrophora]|nr:MAG: hypothetical protein M1833_002001 [Piccolia ochrophora]